MAVCVLHVWSANIRLESLVAPIPAIYTVRRTTGVAHLLQQLCFSLRPVV